MAVKLPDLRATLLAAWRTNNRVTVQFIQRLPAALWDVAIPGQPRRTIRSIAAHIHNGRCRWVKTLGREHGCCGSRGPPEALEEAAGGRVLTPRTDIGPGMGAFAIFADPVGNEFGLYEERHR